MLRVCRLAGRLAQAQVAPMLPAACASLRQSLPAAASFPVFLAGPRICLGKDMAFLSTGSLLTALLARFDIKLDPSEAASVTYDISLTMWTRHGMRVKFLERPWTRSR